MSFINVTLETKGILFDLSNRDGAGTSIPKYIFRPSVFHIITRVEVYDDRMVYHTVETQFFNFTFDGTEYVQLKVGGVTASDNYDLFNKFIAFL